MKLRPDDRYRAALGARVLSVANDLKRTPQALADELGYDVKTIRAVIAGRVRVKTVQAVVRAMTDAYPVALADLWVEPDDTTDGVKVMRAEDGAASARVFDRMDRDGALAPYYEYRDTAMSRTAPFKPEWIQPLRVVTDADPDNPDVVLNNGHLLHQTTFVIGEVNFYWRMRGRRHCFEMNTGDSNYLTPFVPHSFTSRNPDKLGLILAVTYAGQVRHALDEFGRIGASAADDLAGDLRDGPAAFLARLDRHLAAESLSRQQLVERLGGAGIEQARATALTRGEASPTTKEAGVLAASLNLRLEDLMISPLEEREEVVLCLARDGRTRPYPDDNRPAYRLRELARTRHQPGLKGLDVTVLDGTGEVGGEVRHGLHEYIYNYADAPVALSWGDGEEAVLAANDSAYVRPMIGHRFSCVPGAGDGHLAVVRVPGALSDAAINEYAAFATDGRGRVAGEDRKWF